MMPAKATCLLCDTSEVIHTAFALSEWAGRHEECGSEDPDSLEVVTYEHE